MNMASAISILNNPAYTGTAEQASAGAKKELGKNDFLNLLITQLKNQDPLNPMKDTEFIAQLATFSTVEQIGNMNKTIERNFSLGLMGAQVTDIAGVKGTVNDISIDMQGDTVFTVAYQELGKDGKMQAKTKEVKFEDIKEVNFKA
jgi:flagellar basal-body rod modification protein FlgD